MRMLRTAIVIAGVLPMMNYAPDGSPSRQEVMNHLQAMHAQQTEMMNVDPAEGEYLSNLVIKVNAKRALEIGTSNGYSGIWLALGLKQTGGEMTNPPNHESRRRPAQEKF